MTTSATSLGTTLRAWRDRVSPAAAGLPSGHARRAPGLRREEVAELGGISVDYIVRLEQGRATTPSAQVVASLARALQLTDQERDHLHRLAGLVPPAEDEVSEHIPQGLRRILDRLAEGSAVAVFAADWQLIWWNRGWAALLGDPSAKPVKVRNFARDTFGIDDAGPHLSHWPVTSLGPDQVEAAVASDLRRATGRYPRSVRLGTLVRELIATSETFADLWATGAVGSHLEDRKVVAHPSVGQLTVDCDVLVAGPGEQKIVVMSAAAGTEDEIKLKLAMVSGVCHPASAPL
ncbi:MAG: helix-turn-helix transcriptional regulator [Aeromicrobium sp.]